jgi:dCMP deaminase
MKKKKRIGSLEVTEKDRYYLSIAQAVSKRSPCIPLRGGFGAIVVVNDAIVSTGFTGPARGVTHCDKLGGCIRDLTQAKSGHGYEDCPSVHAEENVVINAARIGTSVADGILYLYGENKDGDVIAKEPCKRCRRAIINAGIEWVIEMTPDGIVGHRVKRWCSRDSNEYKKRMKDVMGVMKTEKGS